MRYLIRPMERKDIDAIVEGEKKIFGDTLGYDYLLSELEINPFSQYLVLEIGGKVAGYIGLWIADNMQILNFYVDKEYQNMGYGSMMMEFVVKVCEKSHITSLTLEVRESNEKAIRLYKKFGLEEVAVRKNYYNNGENALLMERKFEVDK